MKAPAAKTALSFVDDALTVYCESSTSDEPPLCRLIREQTQMHPKAHWICGPIVGTLLATLVRLQRAKLILEIGTFHGYSAAYMASANPELKIISLERDTDLATKARTFIANSPFHFQIQIENAEAESWLCSHPEVNFELIFFDSDKSELMRLHRPLLNALRPGGILVMDNACLRGKVLTPQRPWDHETRAFTSALKQDPQFLTTLLPIRDGILLAYKLPPI